MKGFKLLCTVLLLLLAAVCCHAQGENNVWINNYPFASVDFNSRPDPSIGNIPLTAAWFGPFARTASICDTAGHLLFYTNGRDIYSNDGDVMPNGSTNLAIPNYYFITPALIIPLPLHPSRYFVFTLSSDSVDHADLYYSVVDMTLNNGKGDIVPDQKSQLVRTGLMQSFLIGARSENCNLWIAVREKDRNTFISYPVTAEGMGDPVYSVAGPQMATSSNPNRFGLSNFMFGKRSNDHRRLTLVSTEVGTDAEEAACSMYLLRFDRATGRFSDDMTLFEHVVHGYWSSLYPSCFSPDDSKLYTTDYHDRNGSNKIMQYDLSQPGPAAILQSRVLVDTLPVPSEVNEGYLTDMRMGPDERIYIASLTPTAPARINKPNEKGIACSVQRALTPPLTFYSVPVLFAEEAIIPHYQDHSGFLGPDTTLCNGTLLTLALPHNEGITYTWPDGSGGDHFDIRQGGNYISTLHSACGNFTDSVSVTFQSCSCNTIWAPDAFSPNGDGINDEFLPVTDCGSNIRSYSLTIYNRWGQQVFSSMDAAKGWRGTAGNQQADAGTYFYVVKALSSRDNKALYKKGAVVLLR